MTTAALEIAVILLLVAANGVLAGSEIAIVSARRIRLRRRAEAGDMGAARVLELLATPNRFLSTVQIGITAVAVMGGALGGARVAETLGSGFVAIGMGAGPARQLGLVLVVALITFLMLVAGELVPKRIALHAPEPIAARVSGPMLALAKAATPLVRVLSASTEALLRFVPLQESEEPEVTEEEIEAMIAHATESGVLEATEQQIVERLFHLSDRTAGMLQTPRERIIWLDAHAAPESWRERMGEVRHTRFLVADGDLDRTIGYVNVQDLLRRALDGEPLALEPALRQPHVVPDWTPAFRILERFQWSGEHIALVTGADDRVTGLVTLNDILEGIIGDIPDHFEVPRPGIIEREDGSWLVDGLLPSGEFADYFRLAEPDEARQPTVHALVSALLHGEPRAAAVVHWQSLRLEVVDMDGSRVDKVLVSRDPAPGASD